MYSCDLRLVNEVWDELKINKEKSDMFSNIGSKIKAVARVFCWVGIVLSLIVGIVMFALSNSGGLVS